MPRRCASKGGMPAPYTKYRKRPFDYTALYRRHSHLRHWLHNPVSEARTAPAPRENEQ